MDVELYRSARSDLVEAELMLELGRWAEAETLAEQSALAFDELGIKYDGARATVLCAAARFQRGEISAAGRLLREARKLSAREENRYWRAILDLYRALVHEHEQQFGKARHCVEQALRVLTHSPLMRKRALCHLLLGRMAINEGKLDEAQKRLREAEPLVCSAALRFHFHYLLGLLSEQRGNAPAALQEIARAAETREDVRQVRVDEIHIPFLSDETEVYEAGVRLSLPHPNESLRWVRRAKAPPVNTPRMIARLRGGLKALYKELEAEETGDKLPVAETLRELSLRIRNSEEVLLRHEVESTTPIEWPEEGSTVVEYFLVGEKIHGWAVTRDKVEHAECGGVRELKRALRLWQLQRGASVAGPALGVHLQELRAALVAPLRRFFRGTRIVFRPDGFLKQAPFADLIDEYEVSHKMAVSLGRQEVNQRGGYAIEIRWDDEWVAGQILQGEEPMGRTAVTLLAHKSVLEEITCNEFGEFVMDIPTRQNLRVRLELVGDAVELYKPRT